MLTAIKNRIQYSPETSQAIGDKAGQQRMAYNQAVSYTLAHPNVDKFALQQQLTQWRQGNPATWHGTVASQRPGLYRGRLAVRQFHQADAGVLRECVKEVKYAQSTKPKSAKPPRQGNNPTRDNAPRRLYRSRKAPITLSIEDQTRIQQLDRHTVKLEGLTLRLTRPLADRYDIRAVHIKERKSSQRHSRNRPLAARAYQIHLIVAVADPEPKPLDGPLLGLDAGIVHTLTASDGTHYDCKVPSLDHLATKIAGYQARQKRLKQGSRQWQKIQSSIKQARRQASRIKDNWEHQVCRQIAVNNAVVVVEDLKHQNMRRSAAGTSENPSKQVAPKRGLNRGLSQARPGAVQVKLARHCEKQGASFIKVAPHYTSVTCPLCGHRHRENRKSQAVFRCQSCDCTGHADVAAVVNVALRGQAMVWLCQWLMLTEYQAATGGRECRR